jgi:hypothetical protein
MSNSRSSRPEVRNPVLALPAARRLRELDAPSRAALRAVLEDLRRDAHARAEKSWRARKGLLGAYWRAVGVYAGHLSRALRDGSCSEHAGASRKAGAGECVASPQWIGSVENDCAADRL